MYKLALVSTKKKFNLIILFAFSNLQVKRTISANKLTGVGSKIDNDANVSTLQVHKAAASPN